MEQILIFAIFCMCSAIVLAEVAPPLSSFKVNGQGCTGDARPAYCSRMDGKPAADVRAKCGMPNSKAAWKARWWMDKNVTEQMKIMRGWCCKTCFCSHDLNKKHSKE